MDNFEKITALFVGIGSKTHKNPWFNKNPGCRISKDLSVETIRFWKFNWGKNGQSSSSLQQRCQSFQTCFIFDNIVPILDPFRKYTSIRNTIGSGLKHVATGSVWKSYQVTLFAQLSEIFTQKRKIRPQGLELRKMFRATSWIIIV